VPPPPYGTTRVLVGVGSGVGVFDGVGVAVSCTTRVLVGVGTGVFVAEGVGVMVGLAAVEVAVGLRVAMG